MTRLPSGDAVMPLRAARHRHGADLLARREIEHRHEQLVVLVGDVRLAAVGQHGDPMAGAFVIDRVDDAARLGRR